MNVDEAKAQLALAEAGARYRRAKAAYQDDPKKKAAFVKARSALVAIRDDWRTNWRVSPNGPGDAVVTPEPVSASVEVHV